MARSKLKSRSHYDIAHLHPLTNVPIKYQLPTSYGFWDIAQTRFSNSRSLWQGQRSNQGHTMTLHTYTPNQYPYQVSTSYTLRFLRYRPDKLFPLPAHPPIRTPWIKTIPDSPYPILCHFFGCCTLFRKFTSRNLINFTVE